MHLKVLTIEFTKQKYMVTYFCLANSILDAFNSLILFNELKNILHCINLQYTHYDSTYQKILPDDASYIPNSFSEQYALIGGQYIKISLKIFIEAEAIEFCAFDVRINLKNGLDEYVSMYVETTYDVHNILSGKKIILHLS